MYNSNNPGFIKENSMIMLFNNKKVKDLSGNARNILTSLFGKLDEEEIVVCEKVENYIKPDFVIQYKKARHYISMKSGRSNVVHQELIKNFILYIRSLGISARTQQTILLYQFGDGTMDGSAKSRFTYDQLRYHLSDRIKEANEELNANKDFVLQIINRCIFKGTSEENQPADYTYHGDAEYGVLVSKNQIIRHCLIRDWKHIENLHIGPIQIRPHARYIDKEIRHETSRQKLECYWPNYAADLKYIKERYDVPAA